MSILARPEGRAPRPCGSTIDHPCARFNPRPTRRPGATRRCPADRRWRPVVSKRAPPQGRAPQGNGLSRRAGLLFQSSPDPKAGRPPIATDHEAQRDEFLSSPDPKAGRHVLLARDGTNVKMFQSSPDPKAGQHMKSVISNALGGPRFNPRPTRRPGATDTTPPELPTSTKFQSSPDPKAGRHMRSGTASAACQGFQSSPDPKAGAQHDDGMLRTMAASSGFNPRADPKAGRYAGPVEDSQTGMVVSILARPEGRAYFLFAAAVTACKLFQSSPDPKAGRHLIGTRFPPREPRFQSSPDPKAGRHAARPRQRGRRPCFNPRPTRRPGATCCRQKPRPGRQGFNPRPTRRPGATSPNRGYAPPCSRFNPPPTRRPGAHIRGATRQSTMYKLFQSSPDPKAGRPYLILPAYPLAIMFQSSPDPKAGRHPAARMRLPDSSSFQSSPDPKAGRYHQPWHRRSC